MILRGKILHPDGSKCHGGVERDDIVMCLWGHATKDVYADIWLRGTERAFRFWPHTHDEVIAAGYLLREAPRYPSSHQLLLDRFPIIAPSEPT